MNKRLLYGSFFMGLGLLYQSTQALSYRDAVIASTITAVGITAGSYALFKYTLSDSDSKKEGRKALEQWVSTGLLAGPLSYFASVLWFGLTPEMRYVFGSRVADDNRYKGYAIRRYDRVEALIEDFNSGYLSREWLVDLHSDLVYDLQRTNRALRGWQNAQSEERVEKFLYIDSGDYKELREQKACLEYNLFLLRSYRPFQQQQNAWMYRERRFDRY